MAYLADRDGGLRMDARPQDFGEALQTETVVRLGNVVMRYPGQDRPALTIEALKVNAGERVALIWHRLGDVCERYGISNDRPHDALHDARATAAALTHLLAEHHVVSADDLTELYERR